MTERDSSFNSAAQGVASSTSTGAVMPSIGDLRATITSAPMSAILIVVNAAVFVAVTIEDRLLDVLALPPSWAGIAEQPWTLFTVFFSTYAWFHVGAAILVIAVFGVRLERVVGAGHVLAVYMLAGLAGSVAIVTTAPLTGFDETALGASAAFLGLVGALAVLPRSAWGKRLEVNKWVVVVLATQILVPVVGVGDWVSSAAHVAGLAVGAGYVYLLRARRSQLPEVQTTRA